MDNKKPFRKVFTENASRKGIGIFIAAILLISVFAAITTPVSANNGVTPEQKKEAIEKGLAWLAAQQNPDGSWGTYYPVSETAFAVLKFEHYAKHVREPYIDPFDPNYEYSDEIERGWHYIFNKTFCIDIDPQWNGTHLLDPDVNRPNGIGTYFLSPGRNRPVYETGIVMMALETSCHPERIVDAPEGCVHGLTYLDVMKDTVDYIAWAQNDFPNAGRGGWRYGAYDNGTLVLPGFGAPASDNSVSQWPALGLMSAEAPGWNVRAPDWVKTELLNHWLNYSQDPTSGCFWYTGPGSLTGSGHFGVTAAGLTELTYCGVTTDDERWVNASRCICKKWGEHNIGNLYAMYGLMKAAMTAQPQPPNPVWDFCGHKWQPEYDAWLIDLQVLPDGYWEADGYWANRILATEWALLILEKVVPPVPTPPPAPVPAITPIGIIALIGLLSIVAAISISIRKKRR